MLSRPAFGNPAALGAAPAPDVPPEPAPADAAPPAPAVAFEAPGAPARPLKTDLAPAAPDLPACGGPSSLPSVPEQPSNIDVPMAEARYKAFITDDRFMVWSRFQCGVPANSEITWYCVERAIN